MVIKHLVLTIKTKNKLQRKKEIWSLNTFSVNLSCFAYRKLKFIQLFLQGQF